MATVAHGIELQSSGNVLVYTTSATLAPSVGDQLVVFSSVAATVDNTATMTESAGGGAYTLVEVLAHTGTAARLYVHVRDTLCENTTARTFTLTLPVDAGTNCLMSVAQVVGLSKAGTAAVRQVASKKDAAATTPDVVMDFAIDTANPVIAYLVNGTGTNPGVTLPTGFTSLDISTIGTPTNSSEYSKDESGNTSTTITWGSSSATAWGAAVIEFDTTAVAASAIPDIIHARR